jgi:hypothetical protein
MTCANAEVGHFTRREMPIIHLANAADSRGRPDGPGSAGGGAGHPQDVFPAADRWLVLSPRDRARAGPRRQRVAQGRGRNVQSVAALVPVAGPVGFPELGHQL